MQIVREPHAEEDEGTSGAADYRHLLVEYEHREDKSDHRLEIQIVGGLDGSELYDCDGPHQEGSKRAYQTQKQQIVEHIGVKQYAYRGNLGLDSEKRQVNPLAVRCFLDAVG